MLQVKDVGRRLAGGHAELYATVTSGRKALPAQQAWLRYPEGCFDGLSRTSDAFVPGMLLAAMRLGMPLRVEGVISEKMLEGAQQFMEIIHGWCRAYRPVRIVADEVAPAQARGSQIGAFFSGGVDSFYTALKNGGPEVPSDRRISTLIFIQGFDIKLADEALYRTVLDRVAAAAHDLGKELLCVATNLKHATRRACDWRYYHGQVLASAALGLEGFLRRVHIPATYSLRDGTPHGSHPLLDPLWSTETLDVVHDGCEVTRIEKMLSAIVRSPTALAHLRVCMKNHGGKYNCGKCPRCLRAKASLTIAGALSQCQAFDGTLDYDAVATTILSDASCRLFTRDILEAAIANRADPRLIRALARSLSLSARLRPRYWPIYARQASRTLRRRLFGGVFEKATWQCWLRG